MEENPSQDSKQGGKQPASSDAKPTEPLASANPVSVPTSETPKEKPKEPRKLLVEIIRDDELKPFERDSIELAKQTLKLSKQQARFTFWAVIVAALAAAFVWAQVKQAIWNNQILASQSESAVAGAIIAELNTNKQLTIAQQQADAAQKSLEFIQGQMRLDQRAWVGVIGVNTEGGTETTDGFFSIQRVTIAIHNSGKTPAVKISGDCCIFRIYLSTEPIPNYDSELRKPEASSRKSTFHHGGVLAPTVTNQIGVIEQADFAARNEKSWPFTVYALGKFTYHDIFPGTKEHATTFCLMRATGTSFTICPESNWMD